jgi:ribosome hibernation promoting factor
MRVIYKGVHHDLPPKVERKLDAKFSKLSKLLEQRGEKEAHVVVTQERHLHNAEITLQFYDHKLVATGSNSDLFAAVSDALVKLEKQAVKHRSKFREKGRRAAPDETGPDKAGPDKAGQNAGRAARASAKAATAKQPPMKQADGRRATKGAAGSDVRGTRIFRVDHHDRRKPITVEEAMLHMEDGRDYMVYRDSEKECVSVLVRRKDGHFDLVEV